MVADLGAAFAAARAELTGPGGPFEIVEEEVRGSLLPVFVHRRRSLAELLRTSKAPAERDYLVDGDNRITFGDHARLVASLAAELRDTFGIREGDRVAIFAANCAEWVMSFWAAASLGAVTVGCNAWWTPRELSYALEHCSPRIVITDAAGSGILDQIDIAPVLRTDRDIPALAAAHAAADIAPVAVGEDEPVVIMYTSGTTGFPKGAVHSVRNLLAVLDYHLLNDAVAAAVDPRPRQPRRFLMSMPLFHIGSLHNLVLPRLVTADTVVIDGGRFDADRVLRLVERERVTNWALVPTMASRVADRLGQARYDMSSLTTVSVNSAPSSIALKDRLRATLPSIGGMLTDSYGLTESCTAATIATPFDLSQAPATVGRPIAGVGVQVRDADGRVLPDGETGEICLRSAYNMLGYWNDPAATAAAFDPDGWLRTGDLGYLRGGMLFMNTRRSDLILRGGENVYPAEVEAVLEEHSGVAECAVFGVDHAELGEEVAAVVVTVDGPQAPTAQELADFIRERLAYYKVPARWHLTTSPLPRTATGKVIRTSIKI